MLAPTPLLRPGPLDIGGIFAGTVDILKRRFGLFVLITLFPMVVLLVGLAVGVALGVGMVLAAVAGDSGGVVLVGILIGMVVYAVAIVAMLLVQLKSFAMMSAAAYETAQGQRPDFRGLLRRTRGFLPRMAPVIAIGFGCLVVTFGALAALMFGSMAGSRSRGGGYGALSAMIGTVVLLGVLLVPLAIFINIKLLYLIPATAIEERGGIDAIKRSWTLTRGAFWRTLGYYALAYLAVYAVTSVVGMISQFAQMPILFASMSSLESTSDPSAILASMAVMIPMYVILVLLSLAVELVTVPFLHTYVTLMFIDQVRRSELPASPCGAGAPAYGYGHGQYYAQPSQYYGTPAPGSPPPARGGPPAQGQQQYPQPGSPAPWPIAPPRPPADQPGPPASS